jgi:hypothetical protein
VRRFVACRDADEFAKILKLVGTGAAANRTFGSVDMEFERGRFAESDQIGLMHVESSRLMRNKLA